MTLNEHLKSLKPTELSRIITDNTSTKISARKLNRILEECGFQSPNPNSSPKSSGWIVSRSCKYGVQCRQYKNGEQEAVQWEPEMLLDHKLVTALNLSPTDASVAVKAAKLERDRQIPLKKNKTDWENRLS